MTEEQTINVAIGEDMINVIIEGGVAQISYLEEGAKLRFNGESGDTYFVFNASTNKLELWINGVKKAQWS